MVLVLVLVLVWFETFAGITLFLLLFSKLNGISLFFSSLCCSSSLGNHLPLFFLPITPIHHLVCGQKPLGSPAFLLNTPILKLHLTRSFSRSTLLGSLSLLHSPLPTLSLFLTLAFRVRCMKIYSPSILWLEIPQEFQSLFWAWKISSISESLWPFRSPFTVGDWVMNWLVIDSMRTCDGVVRVIEVWNLSFSSSNFRSFTIVHVLSWSFLFFFVWN